MMRTEELPDIEKFQYGKELSDHSFYLISPISEMNELHSPLTKLLLTFSSITLLEYTGHE